MISTTYESVCQGIEQYAEEYSGDHSYALDGLEQSVKQINTTTLEGECPDCQKKLSHRKALLKHKRRCHQRLLTTVWRYHCDRCGVYQYNTMQEFIAHCQVHHRDNLSIMTRLFKTHQDFEEWKKETEKITSARYIKKRGTSKGQSFTVTKYYCSRSGFHRGRVAHPKKAMKAQGSLKIGKHCTSFMTARTSLQNGRVFVEYCLDHVSHGVDLAHIPISDDTRNKIAAKLLRGVEVDKILDELQRNMTEVTRDSLVTRKDIYNIKHQFGIFTAEKRTINNEVSDVCQETSAVRDTCYIRAQSGTFTTEKDSNNSEESDVCQDDSTFSDNHNIKAQSDVSTTDSHRNTSVESDVCQNAPSMRDIYSHSIRTQFDVFTSDNHTNNSEESDVCQDAPAMRDDHHPDDNQDRLRSDCRKALNLLAEFVENTSCSDAIQSVTTGMLDALKIAKHIEQCETEGTAKKFPTNCTFTSD